MSKIIEGNKNRGNWYLVYTTHSDLERPGYRTYREEEVLLKATCEDEALSEAQTKWRFIQAYQHHTPNQKPYLIYKIWLPEK